MYNSRNIPSKVSILTEFQAQYVLDLHKRPEFARMLIDPNAGSEQERKREQGPIVIAWYDKAGTLHADRLGLHRILQTVQV